MSPTDITAISELAKLIQAGGNVAVLLIAFLAWKIWQSLAALDKRVSRVEIHMGIDTTNPPAPPPATPAVVRSIAVALLVIGGALTLSGCQGLSGQIVGASVSLGGFTVGVSGTFPQQRPAPPIELPPLDPAPEPAH